MQTRMPSQAPAATQEPPAFDVGSLDLMRDLYTPADVSWWPLAPGWWIVTSVLLTLAIVYLVVQWRKWSGDAYRRQAVVELQDADSLAAIATLLKRVALVAYPRSDVASLSGTAWCNWLERESGICMSEATKTSLCHDVYLKDPPMPSASIRDFAMTWIRKHRGGNEC